jgi:hypothetical protein
MKLVRVVLPNHIDISTASLVVMAGGHVQVQVDPNQPGMDSSVSLFENSHSFCIALHLHFGLFPEFWID